MRNRNLPMRTSDAERGSAFVAIFVIVLICGGLVLSVLLPNIARHREARAAVERERAFHLAEAGIDYGIAEMRKSGGTVPSTATETGTPGTGNYGSFTLTYTAGNNNGRDDDGDGVADDADESALVQLESTGTYGAAERSVRVMMRRSVSIPTIVASIQFNVENPIIDLNGNSFFVSGFEHDLTGTKDTSKTASYGLAAPTDAANLAGQVPSKNVDQIEGAGGNPSVTYVDAIDLDTLVEQAKSAKTVSLTPATTYSQLSLGSSTPGDVVVAVCEGDLHLTGQAEGYGILVVDGDMKCSGQLLWTGIILIRGRCDLTGGGAGKRLIGAMIVGEEVIGGIDETQTVKIAGTVDMLYSTEAVELAQQRLAMMTVLSWQEVAAP